MDLVLSVDNFVITLNKYITKLKTMLDYPGRIASSLSIIVSVDSTFAKIVPLIRNLKYIGPVIQSFFKFTLHPVVLAPVTPAKNEFDKLNLEFT
jgi:hypothetical protein